MHRDAPDYAAQEEELETRAYDPDHLHEVQTDIRANFDRYFDTLADASWKLPLVFQQAIKDFEAECELYQDFLDRDALEEYEDDPNSFKKAIKSQCPIVRRSLNSRAKAMEGYQRDFNATPGRDMLKATRSIVAFGHEYAGRFDYAAFLAAKTPADFGLKELDQGGFGTPGVIGGGIRTIFLYNLWPHIFPTRGPGAIWALYFLTNRKNYGFRGDSEFLMVQEEGTQQNYFYPYDLFVFHIRLILLLLEPRLKAAGVKVEPHHRFVYVDRFLQHVRSVHDADVRVLAPQGERDE